MEGRDERENDDKGDGELKVVGRGEIREISREKERRESREEIVELSMSGCRAGNEERLGKEKINVRYKENELNRSYKIQYRYIT